ncbi:uncharacterized protein LOC121389271 [Gigantopelta aegis]|uniref:uncharacterized protein LOC121389271 n=1 Tax=Gigantopelta aegis TaxID=1735272 RepID=UPI001B889051|nr:uncharacterized protein LOC121389271 [Gigantopelta aegis]
MRIFRHKASVTAQNCLTKPKNLLYLAGDVGYGFDSQFEAEGRTALRLAHFVSNFLQNTSPNDNFGTLRGGGRLHMEHLFGEVLANVMANHKIVSSGIFWDTHQFVNQDDSTREFFGPLAYKQKGSFYTIDSAGLSSRYIDEDWYTRSKSRWSTNIEKLDTYKLRPLVRSNPEGTSSVQFEYFPMSYKAPAYKDGFWTRPTFKCDGRVDEWVLTYVVPFFGLDGLKKKIQFKGVVTVDVPLNLLEIDQCPSPFYMANAFKNTARCDQLSTKCRKQNGFLFMRGAYRCDCRQGFEYPHADGKFWIEGSLLELEWEKQQRGLYSRFDLLKCRISGAGSPSVHLIIMLLSTWISLTLPYVMTSPVLLYITWQTWTF